MNQETKYAIDMDEYIALRKEYESMSSVTDGNLKCIVAAFVIGFFFFPVLIFAIASLVYWLYTRNKQIKAYNRIIAIESHPDFDAYVAQLTGKAEVEQA